MQALPIPVHALVAGGYAVVQRDLIPLAGGLALPVTRMAKALPSAEDI